MKNLKRIFSLALAGTMLAGMLTVGASAADFTDADSIKNSEAVDTMVALNIINGKDDGSFAPEATVTRAEMAKMITIMLNGGSEPALTASASNAKFTDIGGHWAQKYIEYCVSQNVIAGRGDGTFAPDATVTGTEAAKMALTALGYNSEVFNFTGIDWQVNVNAAANAPSANLYEGLRNINPGEGLSRDNAAQMLYNALDANVVEITYNITSNGVETGYVISDKKTMMSEKFGAVKVEGVVVANEIAAIEGDTLKEGKTKIKSSAEEGDWKDTIVVNTTTDLNLLGRTVSVYVKSSSKKTDATVLGNIVLSDSNSVYTDATGEKFNEIEDGVKTGKDTKYFENYAEKKGTAPDKGTAGVTTILVDNNNDDTVEYVFLVKYTVAQVKKVNDKEKEIQFNGGLSTLEYKNMFGYEDLKAEDVVLSTQIGDNYYLEIPETVEGEIEEHQIEDKKAVKLTVDGTTYDVANVGNSVANLTAGCDLTNNLGDEGIFYLDSNDMIVAYAETEASAAQYALSWGGADGNKLDAGRIKLTLEDGTTSIYTIDSKSDVKIASNGTHFTDKASSLAVGTLVSYTIKSNGNVTLELPEKPVAVATSVDFKQGKTLINDNSATSRTVFFYVEMTEDGTSVDSVEVYTGYKDAPSVDSFESGSKAPNKGVSLALDRNADKVVAAAFVDAKSASSKAKLANHLWVKSLGTSNKDYTNVKVVMEDGSEETIKVAAGDKALKDNGVENIYLYTINSDNYYELTLASTGDTKDNFATGTVYDITGDTVIVTVKGEGNKEEKVEFSITTDTVEYDHAKNSALEEGAEVDILFDKDEKDILMIVVTKKADKV